MSSYIIFAKEKKQETIEQKSDISKDTIQKSLT